MKYLITKKEIKKDTIIEINIFKDDINLLYNNLWNIFHMTLPRISLEKMHKSNYYCAFFIISK